MDSARIAALLAPFLPAPLQERQLAALATYLDLLLRWNARMNLTSVRDPEHIVTRHFGESLFAAAQLFPGGAAGNSVIDLGSGAGFPGLPLKIFAPQLRLALIESQHRKATFLREVVRALALPGVTVFAGRAEDCHQTAEVVTLRAVERFDRALSTAAALVAPAGRLALLIAAPQAGPARQLLPQFDWPQGIPVPQSAARILLIGTKPLAVPSAP